MTLSGSFACKVSVDYSRGMSERLPSPAFSSSFWLSSTSSWTFSQAISEAVSFGWSYSCASWMLSSISLKWMDEFCWSSTASSVCFPIPFSALISESSPSRASMEISSWLFYYTSALSVGTLSRRLLLVSEISLTSLRIFIIILLRYCGSTSS